MNYQLLSLALNTPLEQLLELPYAIRIAYSAGDDLRGYNAEQLQQLLTCLNEMIEEAVQHTQSKPDLEDVRRDDERDLDWLHQVVAEEDWLQPWDDPEVSAQDYYRVLSLYKLGCAIEAWTGTDQTVFSKSVVTAMMESLEALTSADLLPPQVSLEEEIERAWRAGMTPDTPAQWSVMEQVKHVQSAIAKKAADKRHHKHRQAKERALALYFESQYASIELAGTIIGEQVFMAPRTVVKWILEARKARRVTKDQQS